MRKTTFLLSLLALCVSTNANAWYLSMVLSEAAPNGDPYNTFGGKLTIEVTDDDFVLACGGFCYHEIDMSSILYNPAMSPIDDEVSYWLLGWPVGFHIFHWVNWWATGLPTGLYTVDSLVVPYREQLVCPADDCYYGLFPLNGTSGRSVGNVPFL